MSGPVLILNPRNDPPSSRGILIEPIDALQLATVLQAAGHRAVLVDMDVRSLSPADAVEIARATGARGAIAVLDYHIPLHGAAALGNAAATLRALADTGLRVALGGKAATYAPETLDRLPAGAVLIRGEMERTAPRLFALPDWSPSRLSGVEGITFADGSRHVATSDAAPVDLATLPVPDRGLVRLDDYIDVRTLLSSRGCHLDCAFCHVPGFWGRWRARPAESVIAEIAELRLRHGARKILFLDDNATAGRRRMRDICAGLRQRRLDVALGCLGTVASHDPALAAEMREAGFRWIHFGAESGDDRILAAIRKRTTRDAIVRAVAECRAVGLRTRTSWILDLPGTDADALKRTVETILETGSDEIRLHHLSLRMGSAYHASHGAGEGTQYIHEPAPNVRLADVAADAIVAATEAVTGELARRGYAVVRDPNEFADVSALRRRSPELRIVSLCPLRYGLGWAP